MSNEVGHFEPLDTAPAIQPSLTEVFAKTEVSMYGMTEPIEKLVTMCPVPVEERSKEAFDRFTAKLLMKAEVEIPEEHRHLFPEDLRPDDWGAISAPVAASSHGREAATHEQKSQEKLVESRAKEDNQPEAAGHRETAEVQTTKPDEAKQVQVENTLQVAVEPEASPTESQPDTERTIIKPVEPDGDTPTAKIDSRVSPDNNVLLAAAIATAKLESFNSTNIVQAAESAAPDQTPVPIPREAAVVPATLTADILEVEAARTNQRDATEDAFEFETITNATVYSAPTHRSSETVLPTTDINAELVNLYSINASDDETNDLTSEVFDTDTLEQEILQENLMDRLAIEDDASPFEAIINANYSESEIVDLNLAGQNDAGELAPSYDLVPLLGADTAADTAEDTNESVPRQEDWAPYDLFIENITLAADEKADRGPIGDLETTSADIAEVSADTISNPYLDETELEATGEPDPVTNPLAELAGQLADASAETKADSLPLIVEINELVRQIQATEMPRVEQQTNQIENLNEDILLDSAVDSADTLQLEELVELDALTIQLEATIGQLCANLGIEATPEDITNITRRLLRQDFAPASVHETMAAQVEKYYEDTPEQKTDATFISSADDSTSKSQRIHNALGTLIFSALRQSAQAVTYA